MVKCIARLRGITPSNPNMRSEKLRRVFEGLGHENVRAWKTVARILKGLDAAPAGAASGESGARAASAYLESEFH